MDRNIVKRQRTEELDRSLLQREVSAITEIAQPGDPMQLDRSDGIHDLDEKDIEQRMEEDRERHKRLREDKWAVDPDSELEQLFESGNAGLTSKLLEDCVDDAKGRKMAVALDEINYVAVTT